MIGPPVACFARMTHTWRLLQLTDTHLPQLPSRPDRAAFDTTASLRRLVAALGRQAPPDAIILTGDLADTGAAAAYQRLAEIVRPLEAPIYCLPGNHDDPAVMAMVLPPLGVQCPAVFSLGPWQVICLDSRQAGRIAGELGVQRRAALSALLEANRQTPTLIAIHHPPIAVGTPWMDVYALQDGPALLAELARHPHVRGLIYGHIHHAHYSRQAQLELWGTPSTCVQFVAGSQHFTPDMHLGPCARWLTLTAAGTLSTELFTLPADHHEPR